MSGLTIHKHAQGNICLHTVFFLFTVCGALTNPENGRVSYTTGTTFGLTATYGCDTGYNLMGDSIRTCQTTGEWSGSEPTCQGAFVLNSWFVIMPHACTAVII